MEKVTKICEQCGQEFTYDENPSYPRKYCPPCGEARKAAYAKPQVNQPAIPTTAKEAMAGVGHGLSPKDTNITAQCLTKCCAEIAKMQPAGDPLTIREIVLEDYNFFLEKL